MNDACSDVTVWTIAVLAVEQSAVYHEDWHHSLGLVWVAQHWQQMMVTLDKYTYDDGAPVASQLTLLPLNQTCTNPILPPSLPVRGQSTIFSPTHLCLKSQGLGNESRGSWWVTKRRGSVLELADGTAGKVTGADGVGTQNPHESWNAWECTPLSLSLSLTIMLANLSPCSSTQDATDDWTKGMRHVFLLPNELQTQGPPNPSAYIISWMNAI